DLRNTSGYNQDGLTMASGCIIDTCPVCDEIVWEDEWRVFDNVIMHPRCVPEYTKRKHGMNEEQFLRLCGAQDLRQAILDIQKTYRDSMDFFKKRLQDLEERLVMIEKIKRVDGV
ncbi:hypothetical protein, partial [Desulfosporosinus sp. OT]|uniref:hypothetical protein n=1 Tax=Desulfosporosinus sp. OT TaxID=913865 RepID=UPI0032B74CCF